MKIIKLLIIGLLMLGIRTVNAARVTAIDHFDSKQYVGTWYEVARLPFYFEKDCIAPITAHYAIDPNNSEQILVTNTCQKKDKAIDTAQGIAHFVISPTIARLQVNFLPKGLRWLPFTPGDYWVLYTDYDHYSLVGSPNHKYLWILARSEKTDFNKIQQLLDIAEAQGFDTQQLLFNYTDLKPIIKKSQ